MLDNQDAPDYHQDEKEILDLVRLSKVTIMVKIHKCNGDDPLEAVPFVEIFEVNIPENYCLN